MHPRDSDAPEAGRPTGAQERPRQGNDSTRRPPTVGEVLERIAERWPEKTDYCPVCDEWHYFATHERLGLVSCGWSDFAGDLDELAARRRLPRWLLALEPGEWHELVPLLFSSLPAELAARCAFEVAPPLLDSDDRLAAIHAAAVRSAT